MPQKRGKRKRVAEGIYQDAKGYECVVTVGSGKTRQSKAKRFKRGTGIKEMTTWQNIARGLLRKTAPRVSKHSLEADVPGYLQQHRHLVGWVSRRSELRAWLALYGPLERDKITPAHVRDARVGWLASGVSPKTVNNRVQTLRHLYHALDGKRAWTPCDDIAELPTPKTIPTVIPASVVLAVDAKLQERERAGLIRSKKARARFRVFVATGKRPSELMRAQPEDVDLERRVWIVRDGKGGFSPGVYLNDDMLAAWRLFVEADAWGYFREGSWVKTLRSAGWPANIRPYQARHTVGILMSDAGIDLADIQAHLGHKQIATTRKTYVPVRGSRLQRASEVLDGRLTWLDVDAVRDGTTGTAIGPRGAGRNPRDAPASAPTGSNPRTQRPAPASHAAPPYAPPHGRARVLDIARGTGAGTASSPSRRRPSSYD